MAWWIKAILLSVGWVVFTFVLMMLIGAVMATSDPSIDPFVTGQRIFQIHPCVSILGIVPIWVFSHRRWARK
jgi:ABC-type transport system involved in multi-copper enzyme maturation permease subunit